MTFDWSEYLTLARQLAGETSAVPTGESRQRGAISRAYFAAYCRARNYLRDREGLAIPQRDPHVFVRREFSHRSVPGYGPLGADLQRLHLDRNKADYDDVVPELVRMVEANLLRSARVLAALDAAETGSSA